MDNIFNSVQVKRPTENWFNLSYDHKLSLKFGQLVPTHVQECLPGDIFRVRTETLARLAPMLAPIMQKIDIYTHYFFVPNRILWKDWERFITGSQKPNEVPAFPYLNVLPLNDDETTNKLADYLGIPNPVVGSQERVSALPFAAYNRIWFDYYRDQNLQQIDAVNPDEWEMLVNGDNTFNPEYQILKNRAWAHDYFTSALPFAQKGEAVNIPLSLGYIDVPVRYQNFGEGNKLGNWVNQTTGEPLQPQELLKTQVNTGITLSNTGNIRLNYNPQDTLRAQGNSEGQLEGTINDLRVAMRLQEWLEKNARAGTRYTETLWMHFAVKSSDARLQRAEWLGGTRQPLVISEVLQTSSDTDESAQGNMAGHSVSINGGKAFNYRCEEHGYIIGITSVMPRASYFQGIPKHFSKFDRLDYYWPSFSNIGEQEIKNKELYWTENFAQNEETFGYTPRYADYRFNLSRISGEMRTTLSYWHLARIFANKPNLNSQFITVRDDSLRRVFPVLDDTTDYIYMHIYHHIKAKRKIPKFATPTL